MRAALEASTLTPGSTPPELSFTTPAIVPFAVSCASAAAASSTQTANPTITRWTIGGSLGGSEKRGSGLLCHISELQPPNDTPHGHVSQVSEFNQTDISSGFMRSSAGFKAGADVMKLILGI